MYALLILLALLAILAHRGPLNIQKLHIRNNRSVRISLQSSLENLQFALSNNDYIAYRYSMVYYAALAHRYSNPKPADNPSGYHRKVMMCENKSPAISGACRVTYICVSS